jgi:amidohydrolase
MDQQSWATIERAVDTQRDQMIQLRRRIHATPERSGEERETTALVARRLEKAGLEPRLMQDDLGVIADLRLNEDDDPFIALRSELDCVGVNDDKQTPYASTRPGLCHACGHDAHTAMNLAAATALAQHRDQLNREGFRHNLRFIFQPSEETATGARSMIQQGALHGVEAIFALHVDPFIGAGKLGLRNGPLTSAAKIFEITIRGRGGHSARPYEAVDPIPAATNLVSLLYELCPRSIDSRHPMSICVASIRAGSSFNAIPDSATISGTLRAVRVEELEAVQSRMDAVVDGVERATGCSIELSFRQGCPATDNDPRVVAAIADAGRAIVGPDAAEWLEVPSLGGEDFAFYQELVPGAIVRLGAALAQRSARRPLHSSRFDINEDALPIGAKVMTRSALQLARTFEPRTAAPSAP